MARDFSTSYLDQLRFPRLPTLHARLRAQTAIGALRRAQRHLAPARARPSAAASGGDPSPISPQFDALAPALRTRDWAFCPGIFPVDFHASLLGGWPKRRFFLPAASLEKSWDRGFDWRRGRFGDPPDLDRHPPLRRLFDYLRSDEFGGRFSALVGRPVSCYSFTATMTVTGSVVAPHRDDWAFLEDPAVAYNMVMFVNGAGGHNSGGLAILGTNTFEHVLFEPTELINTALVYDTKAPFYHGFEPVARGKFRWAIITNFVSPDFVH